MLQNLFFCSLQGKKVFLWKKNNKIFAAIFWGSVVLYTGRTQKINLGRGLMVQYLYFLLWFAGTKESFWEKISDIVIEKFLEGLKLHKPFPWGYAPYTAIPHVKSCKSVLFLKWLNEWWPRGRGGMGGDAPSLASKTYPSPLEPKIEDLQIKTNSGQIRTKWVFFHLSPHPLPYSQLFYNFRGNLQSLPPSPPWKKVGAQVRWWLLQ